MQELLNDLDIVLEKINKHIKTHIQAEQIELWEVDELIQESNIQETAFRESMQKFKADLTKYKSDINFWNKDIPALLLSLESARDNIKQILKYTTEIGGKNSPNEDIIKLISQGILSVSSPISKTYKNQTCIGYLTVDGFIEIDIYGIKKKLSLRRAALLVWGTNPPNQWQFWEVIDNDGIIRSLDFFRNKLH